ncbi:unnamed protein product [Calypogeia fissa]
MIVMATSCVSMSVTLNPSSLKSSPSSSSSSVPALVPSSRTASISAFERSSQTRTRVSVRSSFTGNSQPLRSHHDGKGSRKSRAVKIVSSGESEHLKVMIAGAPASGKGTQCELIAEKFGLTHISAGDLLRAEVAAGTEGGEIAKEYMNAGKLVPSEIVVEMVKNRLTQPDVSAGWLLDGYPRSLEQAEALEAVGIRPEIFILLDVPDDILVTRVVGRRSDPVTGKIYHLTFAPPPNEEISQRLVQRFDDKEEKVKARVDTYHANVASVIGVYKDIIKSVDGNRPKLEVFEEIANHISALRKEEGSLVV